MRKKGKEWNKQSYGNGEEKMRKLIFKIFFSLSVSISVFHTHNCTPAARLLVRLFTYSLTYSPSQSPIYSLASSIPFSRLRTSTALAPCAFPLTNPLAAIECLPFPRWVPRRCVSITVMRCYLAFIASPGHVLTMLNYHVGSLVAYSYNNIKNMNM